MNMTITKEIKIILGITLIAILCAAAAIAFHISSNDGESNAYSGEIGRFDDIVYEDGLEMRLRETQATNPPFTAVEQDKLAANPERGFYSTSPITITPDGAASSGRVKSNTNNVLYVKVDLSAFSNSMNGGKGDLPLTDKALDAIRNHLSQIKQNNNTVILRFVYDNNATGKIPSVYKCEPAQDMLLHHVEQLAPIFKDFASTINIIQCGFYGLWGEGYFNTDNQETSEGKAAKIYDYQTLIPKLLEVTRGTDINIAVRTPEYYSWYRGIDINEIDGDITTPDEEDMSLNKALTNADKNENGRYKRGAYRVAIFNDGYAAAADDLGTYSNRERETDWLNAQTQRTFYGGEALPDDTSSTTTGSDSVINRIGPYNTAMQFIKEAYKLHTSYANWEWNQALHKEWNNQVFTGMDGVDELYNGMSGLDFIETHLGYRFVLRESAIDFDMNSKSIKVGIAVENVGFGNLLKNKRADLVLVSGPRKYVIENISIDAKKFTVGDTVNAIVDNIVLPEDVVEGNYKVYLRFSSGEKLNDGTIYSSIMFANSSLYSNDLAANYIGSVEVVGKPAEPTVYAVFSETDGSLNFYNRVEVPEEGTTWNDGEKDRIATNVYFGFENIWWVIGDGFNTWEWWEHRASITNVTVVDKGIAPITTAFWFGSWGADANAYQNLTKVDLAKLDVTKVASSNTNGFQNMFCGSENIKEIDLSGWNTAGITNTTMMFLYCTYTERIYVGDGWDLSSVNASNQMFGTWNTVLTGNDGTKYPGKTATDDKTNAHYGTGGYLTYKTFELS